jgi:hypothetical protein
MNATGRVSISGSAVDIQTDGSLRAKGESTTVEGTAVRLKGSTTTVEATGPTNIKGAIVNIN